MNKSIFLVLTSAIAIDGAIARAGSLVEVSELEAKNLLHRGKARLATAEDGAPADESADSESDKPDLSRMNKAQLLEFCAANQIEVNDSMTKAQILAAVEEATQEAN